MIHNFEIQYDSKDMSWSFMHTLILCNMLHLMDIPLQI